MQKIDGKWDVIVKTPMGDRNLILHLETDAGELLGSVKSPEETNEILDGTVKGSDVFWRNKVSKPMAMDVEMTATVDGDAIAGSAKTPFGSAPFSGRRLA